MSLPPSTVPAVVRRPWENQDLSVGARLGLFTLTIVLVSILIVALIASVALASPRPGEPARPGEAAAAVVVALVCAAGLVWSIRLQRRSVRFKLRYTPPPPTSLGQPFDVLYSGKFGLSRSLTDRGGARFDSEGLTVHGELEPPPLLQVVVFLLLTVVPLVLLGIGLGVILAIFVTRRIGRSPLTRTIPYSQIRELEVKGLKVTFLCEGQPGRVAFTAASADGERLYRELAARFPSALGGWTF